MRILPILALLVSIIVFTGCDKYRKYTNAMVIDSKNLSDNGCGYMLLLEEDKKLVLPSYLKSTFRSDSMRVKVKIKTVGNVLCNSSVDAQYYDEVEVEDIVRNLD